MGIKLKNKKTCIIMFIVALYFMGTSLILVSSVMQNKGYIWNRYFDSDGFKNELASLVNNIYEVNGTYKDYSHKTIDEKVDREQFNNRKEQYKSQLENTLQQIEQQYKYDIDRAEEEKNNDRAKRLIEERDKKLEEAKKENTKSDDAIKSEIAAEADKQYQIAKSGAESREDIKYYITNKKTNELYSNMGNITKGDVDDYIKNYALYSIKFPKDVERNDYLLQNINYQFQNKQLEGYFIVNKSLFVGSPMFSTYTNYNDMRNKVLIKGCVSLILSVISLAMLIFLSKNVEKFFSSISINSSRYKKLPLDVRIVIILFSTLIVKYYINVNGEVFSNNYFSLKVILVPTIIAGYMYYLLLNIRGGYKLLKNKEELMELWKQCYLHKIIAVARDSFIFKNTAIKIIAVAAATMFLGMAIIAVFNNDGGIGAIGGMYALVYMVIVPFYMLKKIAYLNKITKGTEEIVAGNFNYAIKEKGKGTLYKLAHNINNMKVGVKKSLEGQMKSDRLKSELITNVSHDLKTPLTSIINYIDLLKDKDISKEEMDSYVEILDRKAQRLKVLIEDLFEASKVTSGAVELNIEKVDVVSLLRQSMGEFDEKIKNSYLAFKVNMPTHNVYVNLDGKKTWRVFENLISNILKYSQSNTRVYIDLVEDDTKVKIVMKNISAYEMEFDVEEIFERFKRGDKSRSTEGSGLGLAIAKSIVELQGGSLNIDIDGDLFKVTVEFNK